MDCNIKTEDKKVVMKLLNQYADSYQCLEKQNKVLQESIKDLKTNLKINKDIISNFLSKSTSTEINKSIIAKLNSQVESLTKSNEDLTKQNLSLIQSQNAISQELSILKEEIESKSKTIFILEQSIIKKDNIIQTYKKKSKVSTPPLVVLDPTKAIVSVNDELMTYKAIYKKVSKYLQRNCEKINKYENLITDLQTENGKLRVQNKLQQYSANREKETLLVKLKEEFYSKTNNTNTNNTNISDNNTCVSSYTRMGRMKLGLNTMDDKMRKKLMIAGTNKSVDQFDSSNKYDSEDFNDVLRMAGLSIDHYVLMSKNKLYSKLTDAIEFMHKMIVEKNMCINLLEIENESLNAKNYQLNKENMELTSESKKKSGLGDSMINNTSQITINNVNINAVGNLPKITPPEEPNIPNKNLFTLESVTSSEFKNECDMLPSFTDSVQDKDCLDGIEIKK